MGKLTISRVTLVSPDRTYDIVFELGVTVISGPILTGKTTILKLIDYVFGGRTPPSSPELKRCHEVVVQLQISGEVLCIRRSLVNAQAPVGLFSVPVEDILKGSKPDQEVSWKQLPTKDSVSSVVLGRLGLGGIPVKEAPKQGASKTKTFSLRDLMRLLYFDQSRISSEEAFFESHFVKNLSFRAAVAIVFDFHDSQAAKVGRELEEAQTELSSLEKELEAERRFLDRFDVPSLDDLIKHKAKLEVGLLEQEHKSKMVKKASLERLGENQSLVDRRDKIETELRSAQSKIAQLERNSENLERLDAQYDREISQLKFLDESEKSIGALPVVKCPACLQDIQSHSYVGGKCFVCTRPLVDKKTDVSIEFRLKSVVRRSKELKKYLTDIDQRISELGRITESMSSELGQLNDEISRIYNDYKLPEARESAQIASEITRLNCEITDTDKHIAYRRKSGGEGSRLGLLKQRVENLSSDLLLASDEVASKTEVIEDLSERFRALLEKFEFRIRDGAAIDPDSFLPMVRDMPYSELSSLGAIGLVLFCYNLAILERSLEVGSSHPLLFILDSPFAQFGRDSSSPEFADEKTVNLLYGHLVELHQKYRDCFQIIIIDNMPPKSVDGLNRINFTGSGEGRSGLIS